MQVSANSCLINQSACGRQSGNPVCLKCGMDERVVYPGHADLEVAQLLAEARYWKTVSKQRKTEFSVAARVDENVIQFQRLTDSLRGDVTKANKESKRLKELLVELQEKLKISESERGLVELELRKSMSFLEQANTQKEKLWIQLQKELSVNICEAELENIRKKELNETFPILSIGFALGCLAGGSLIYSLAVYLLKIIGIDVSDDFVVFGSAFVGFVLASYASLLGIRNVLANDDYLVFKRQLLRKNIENLANGSPVEGGNADRALIDLHNLYKDIRPLVDG